MGMIDLAFGFVGAAKIELIRMMVADRTDGDDRVMTHTGAPWRASRAEVMGTPEATVYTIVQTINTLCESGRDLDGAITMVEHHRSKSGLGSVAATNMGKAPYLYVHARISLEHPHVELTTEQVMSAMYATEYFVRSGAGHAQVDAAYYFGRFKAIESAGTQAAAGVELYLTGELDDNEFAGVMFPFSRRIKRKQNDAARVRLQRAINDL